jgi:hypothetical protein
VAERDASFDVPTILAVGMVVYLVKNVLHEGVGHGGTCVMVGCEPQALSSAWFLGADEELSPWAQRAIKAGGTIANLAFAVLLLPLWRTLVRRGSSHGVFAYFVWLSIVCNLLVGGGYMMVDPIFGFGDWTGFLEGLTWPIRFVVIAIGVAISLAALAFGARTIDAFIGPYDRRRRGRWLCLGPYAIGGTVLPLSAITNPGGPMFVLTSALATLGGTSWLVWLAFLVRPEPRRRLAFELPRSAAWIAAGVVAAVVLLAVLGPSVEL